MRPVLLAALFFTAVAACGDSTSPAGPVVSAELLPADTAITGPAMLRGTGLDESGQANNDATVTWTSLTPAVVTVDEAGTVTPVSTGIGRVQIEVEGFTAEATVRAVTNVTAATNLLPLYPFSSGPTTLQVFSDVSQADADSRAAGVQDPWTHWADVFNTTPPNTSAFFTSWRDLWAASTAVCTGVDDPDRAAHSFCPSPPRHFMMAVDDDNETAIRFLGQQYMQANYGAANDFPWLLEGWSSFIAGGDFDENGLIGTPSPRQVILDDFNAADSGSGIVALETLLQMASGTFYAGTPPVPQLVAQAAMFWGWLVTNEPDAAGRVFNEIRLNPAISNGNLLSAMFDELGMDVAPVETAYLAWARAQ